MFLKEYLIRLTKTSVQIEEGQKRYEFLCQLKWMPLLDYFIFRKLILTFKVLHQMTPEYLNVF